MSVANALSSLSERSERSSNPMSKLSSNLQGIIWIMVGTAKGRFHAGYYMPVDLVGLYWHLVDLIWIFLFPLLYLVP